jgi:hypothetical protein
MKIHRRTRLVVSAALLATVSACAGNELGSLGDVLGGVLGTGGTGQQGQLLVEVQGVDTRQQAVHVRTEQGETGSVLFDQNTVVVYRQQQYPVTALERGDIANMQVQRIDQNTLYTSRIDVQQSVQERTGQSTSGATGQLSQFYGQVDSIDHQNGIFQIRTQQGTFTIVLPPGAGDATIQYFHSLRVGQSVTLEGTMSGPTRVDLHRFI